MASKLRVQYLGAPYHVMNRGDRREAIFVDDIDRRLPLALVSGSGNSGKRRLDCFAR
jgi:hypothetical protein